MPFFSVIIPLYNKEDYIADTLNSVLNQSFQDFEVIIVNDGSTDGSLEVVSRFEDHRIIVLNQDNLGLSAARNVGISNAKGKVVALLDADDSWFIKYLETIHFLVNSHEKIDFFATDYILNYNAYESKPIKNIEKGLKGKSFIIEDFFKASFLEPIFTQSNFAFKRHVFNEYNIYDEQLTFGEDIDFYLMYLRNKPIAYSYVPLAKINCSIDSQITQQRISLLKPPNLNHSKYTIYRHSSYLKYLDLHRYIIAYKYKLCKNIEMEKEFLKKINYSNLNIKQLIIIKSPYFLTVLINKIKLILLKINIRVSSI